MSNSDSDLVQPQDAIADGAVAVAGVRKLEPGEMVIAENAADLAEAAETKLPRRGRTWNRYTGELVHMAVLGCAAYDSAHSAPIDGGMAALLMAHDLETQPWPTETWVLPVIFADQSSAVMLPRTMSRNEAVEVAWKKLQVLVQFAHLTPTPPANTKYVEPTPDQET